MKKRKSQCRVCNDLNEEPAMVYISEIKIFGSYYNYHTEIICCPFCGKLRDKYKTDKTEDI